MSQTWNSVWDGFSGFLENLARFGMGDGESGRATQMVAEYGVEASSPTTQAIGTIYLIAKNLPLFILLYLLFRTKFDRVKSLILTTVTHAIYQFIVIVVLELRPNPIEVWNKFAYGPIALWTAVRESFANEPVEAFTVWVVIFGSFFLFSFLFWYLINVGLWLATLTFRPQPIFGDTSAKGIAFWMTIIWVFFLTMDTAGTAFLQTLFVLMALLLNRTLKKRDVSLGDTFSSDEDGGDIQVEDSSTGEIEMTSEDVDMEGESDGETVWM